MIKAVRVTPRRWSDFAARHARAGRRRRRSGYSLAAMRLTPCIALGIALSACSVPDPGPPLPALDLGPSLGATRDDPLLLTFAATRTRSRYLVDQGYTLAWDDDGLPAFRTPDSGDLGVVLEVDGVIYASEYDLATPVIVDHTAGDSAVLHFDVDDELSVELWFYVGTSGSATLDVRLVSTAMSEREVVVFPYLRRCDAPFTGVAPRPDGLVARHALLPVAAPRFLPEGVPPTVLTDALVTDGEPAPSFGRGACGARAADDVGLLVNLSPEPPESSAILALGITRTLAAQSSAEVRVHRAVADAASPDDLGAGIAAERALDARDLLRAGRDRLAALPPPEGASRDDALLHHASMALLDQAMMPKEGLRPHDYYRTVRAPAGDLTGIGESLPESLAMILLARLDPQAALETHRNFIDRVDADGYLPSFLGPVVETTAQRSAAAPLFAYEAREIFEVTRDAAFLAAAYAAGVKVHGFWVDQRDVDHDGLAEWGADSTLEPLRLLDPAFWEDVSDPRQLETVDLNSLLVMEERSLAQMADLLARPAESAAWQALAEARAARINAVMWDEGTGFYYDVARDTETFTLKEPGDLKRLRIGGLLPLWAGVAPADRRSRLLDKLADPALFLRAQGIASLAATDPHYAPAPTACCAWEGAMHVPWQWLIVRGLRDAGEGALADEITARVASAVRAQLARDHQFRNRYDADDATAPNSAMPNYVGGALAALMLLEEP
jgi:hypothetical protein